ncbi:MAG: hypothetical protein GY765_22405 [bacterium]|nr:hypothetical protein [bacterium]
MIRSEALEEKKYIEVDIAPALICLQCEGLINASAIIAKIYRIALDAKAIVPYLLIFIINAGATTKKAYGYRLIAEALIPSRGGNLIKYPASINIPPYIECP